jgi:uncharacterized protein (DUF849 family)
LKLTSATFERPAIVQRQGHYQLRDHGSNPYPVDVTISAGDGRGNVGVGLEDSLWNGKGKLAASNAEQVHLAPQIIEGLGLSIAKSAEAREILSFKGGDRTAI